MAQISLPVLLPVIALDLFHSVLCHLHKYLFCARSRNYEEEGVASLPGNKHYIQKRAMW